MPETAVADPPATDIAAPPAGDAGLLGTPPPAAKPDTSWYGQLPKEYADKPTIASLKDKPIGELAKMLLNAESKIGQKGLIKPGANATPQEVDAYYKALGRPDSPDKYTLPTEGIPEGVKVDQEIVKGFASEAHRLGLTDQQFAGLYRAFTGKAAEVQKGAAEQRQTQRQEAIGVLKEKWGAAFDQNLALAQAGLKKLGGDEAVARAKDPDCSWADDPILCDVLAKAGRMVQGDEVLGSGGNTRFKMTPAEAAEEVGRWLSDAANAKAYYSGTDPGHEAAVKHVESLMQQAHPAQKPV